MFFLQKYRHYYRIHWSLVPSIFVSLLFLPGTNKILNILFKLRVIITEKKTWKKWENLANGNAVQQSPFRRGIS